MITSEVFNRSEELRLRLAQALDLLELAFSAADRDEDESGFGGGIPHDALAYSLRHAERGAIFRYKNRLRSLALVPRETIGPLEATYNGVTPFDQIEIDAIRDHDALLQKQRADNQQPSDPSPNPIIKRKKK